MKLREEALAGRPAASIRRARIGDVELMGAAGSGRHIMPQSRQGGAMSLLERSPLLGFAILTVVAALASWAIYALTSWVSEGGVRLTEDLAAPVAVVLGTAVAFGGSIVAIFLAAYALRLQRQQDQRNDLQVQVELLDLLAEQSSHFLKPYAEMLRHLRELGGVVELHSDLIWTSLDRSKATQVDPQFARAVSPVLSDVAERLTRVAASLDTLYVNASSNAFANAIFRGTFGVRQWSPLALPGGPRVSLASLPTISIMLNRYADHLRDLTMLHNGGRDAYMGVVQARLMANSCRADDGSEFDHAAVRNFLLLGFLVPGAFGLSELQSGAEIRPPLSELVYQLASAYSEQAFRTSLQGLFSANPALAAVLDKLQEFAPHPLDPTMREYLDVYGRLRPRLRMTANGFV
ncbi:MAG: hypothetical protein QN174_01010 [Armatimonadota bacterium]|nr:hypothetical protein [Armatimonadota bacterium]MDR7421070.1 hypothetical protein [Armatimonadota bacterium]MDR7453201.1 hypothetical protein [Armatimonadota bacterium]MDR7457918.1 hypothetical protein [Armatimonadota bacterium]MDR7495528.1 hypothetical protein [Armatimonadota bacterium]